MSDKKGTSTKAKGTPKAITFTKSKETKNAVAFVAEGLENSNIYFKKSELADLGLEGVEEFTMTLEVKA